jgi:phosphonoacetaldehyde hydrolase
MNFVFQDAYCGPLKAVILDWAGTTVDYGSFAPTAAFIKVFAKHGVTIELEHARAPMGLMKKDHLRAISHIAEVSRRWKEAHGSPCSEADIEEMFAEFVPLQIDCLAEYAIPIPGTLEAMAEFRKRGMKIGSTTGYTREMMEVLVPEAQKHGYYPDSWVAANDVPAGRPWMAYQNAIQLQLFPMQAFVKVGDTLPDIEEGLNAGMWSVGLALTGNLMGLTEAEVRALPQEALEARKRAIYAQLYLAGAHYVVDGIADVPAILDIIQKRLAQGERP